MIETEKKNEDLQKTKSKKTCFVVTPIGKPDSDIRRHIDGIINIAIEPAIGDEYLIEAAHTYFDATSITKQVYQKLYESDLVIANLTNLNPNVMYELGIRFCFGKPTILIAKKDTELPFDIIEQRTFFYKDDALGMLELKTSLEKIKETLNTTKVESPIHDALKEVQLFKQLNSENDSNNSATNEMLSLIIKKLDKFWGNSSVDGNAFEKANKDSNSIIYNNLNNRLNRVFEDLSEMEHGQPTKWELHMCQNNLVDCTIMLEKIKYSIDEEQYMMLEDSIKYSKHRLERLQSRL